MIWREQNNKKKDSWSDFFMTKYFSQQSECNLYIHFADF